MNYVIIGNGVAAIGAVEGIRTVDRKGPVTIVSSEPYRIYGRPLISNLLAGKIAEAEVYCRPDDFYEANGVEQFLGRTVRKIDPAGKTISLDNRAKIGFDRLLIATGGVPFVPEIKGREGTDVYTFTTLDDARKLDALVREGRMKKAVVLGGGLIGLKAAESLHDRGVRVTVVELADRILSAAFDQVAGEIIAARLREVGIEVILKNSIDQIARKNGRVKGVVLNDKTRVECDSVVVAIGVVPNKKLAGSSVKTNRGILVDEYLETSAPGIYAAGDVAEAYDLVLGERRVTPIWPNAYLQGRYAGFNMAGVSRKYPGGCAMNSIEFYGVPTVSMGLSNPAGADFEILTRLVSKERIYRKIVLDKKGVIVGAVLVGKIEKAGILTGFILDRTNVLEFKDALLEDDFGLAHLPEEIRKEMLIEMR